MYLITKSDQFFRDFWLLHNWQSQINPSDWFWLALKERLVTATLWWDQVPMKFLPFGPTSEDSYLRLNTQDEDPGSIQKMWDDWFTVLDPNVIDHHMRVWTQNAVFLESRLFLFCLQGITVDSNGKRHVNILTYKCILEKFWRGPRWH